MIIDLRSDTVTKPTPGMLEAMFSAKVGDDVFGEDETVNTLEKKAAVMFGMEAALFCPSGTMTNQIAIRVHTRIGDEVICDSNSHIYHYEGGGIAGNSGVQAKLINGANGILSANQIETAINPSYDWLTRSSLVSLENTVNKAGGSYYQLKDVVPISQLCTTKNLALHLDGARLFNALAETNETPLEWGKQFSSISICLSKGLGAPAGSLLLGTSDFIKQARRVRKVFGGGMRQVGYLAAAGIYALDNHVTRLKEDHKKAKAIAETIGKCAYVTDIRPVLTNIVVFDISSQITAEQFTAKISQKNIKVSAFGPHTIRMVTHLDFSDDQLETVLKELPKLF